MDSLPPISCDCLIVGGGPAGSALACLLAREGLQIVLVEKGRAHHSGPHESLLPGAAAMLERAGCLDLVRAAAEPDALRHGALWGSEEVVWQEAVPGGLCLRRGAFDAALRAEAGRRGAHVRCPARIHGDLAVATQQGVVVVGEHGAQAWLPRVVVAATGRSALGSLLAAERTAVGPATVAVTVVGQAAERDLGTAVVEAVPAGWLWFQAPSPGSASVALLLDAPLPDRGTRSTNDVLSAALAQSRGPSSRLRCWRTRHATDATARCARTSADVILIGDAAATIDPLASQGVEKALAAADHCAAIVRTILRHEDLRGRLREEQRRWEHGLFAAHQRESAAFYAAEERFADAPFWRLRRAAPERGQARSDVPMDVLFEPAPGVRATAALRRVGSEFEACDGMRLGDRVLTHLGFVPVVPLLGAFEPPCTLRQALVHAGRDPRCFVLPPFAVLQALRELVQRGWLIEAANGGCSP